MRRLLFSIALAAIVVPSLASAQCDEGRVASEATAGRCCWPAQHWNEVAGRCEGPPSCPAGRVAAGDDCALAAPVAAPVVALVEPIERPPTVSPYTGRAARIETGTTFDGGLVIAGSVTLGIAYVYSLIVGGIFIFSGGYTAFIPVVGGLVWLAPSLAHGLYFGIAGSAVQIVGLITLIVGLVQQVPTYALAERRMRAGLPSITGGPGDAGIGLGWQF
jgi:hypothetical protein